VEPDAVPASALGPRDVVVVEGPDALSYLQSQVSQDLLPMAVGSSAWTLVLEPAGKVTALARVTRTGEDRFELDIDAGFGAALLARLERFKIRVKAETSLIEAGAEGSEVDRNEAERIELGWPAMGHELIPGQTVPAGTGLSRIAVSFTKGCYPGQELVERMDSRGAESPRTLRRLDVPEGTVSGDDVFDGDQVVGEVTSVVGTRALAWVKRSSGIGETIQH
jgi:folate-binding protein YgfZ